MLQELKERLFGGRRQEPSVKLWAVRYQDASYDLVRHGGDLDMLYEAFQEDGNAVMLEIPRVALGEKGKLIGGHVELGPWGVYPLTARWVPDEETSGKGR